MKLILFAFAVALASFPASAADRWAVETTTSKIDDSTNVVASMPADEVAMTRFGRPSEINAILQCVEGRTGFFIHFGRFYMSDFAGQGVVTVRVDKRKAKRIPMTGSTDHRALGLTGGAAIRAAKGMTGKSTLLIAAVPVNEGEVQASFSLAGFDNAVAAVRAACKW